MTLVRPRLSLLAPGCLWLCLLLPCIPATGQQALGGTSVPVPTGMDPVGWSTPGTFRLQMPGAQSPILLPPSLTQGLTVGAAGVAGLPQEGSPAHLRTQIDALSSRMTSGRIEVEAATGALEDIRRKIKPVLDAGGPPEAQNEELKSLRVCLMNAEQELAMLRGDHQALVDTTPANLKFLAGVEHPQARLYEVHAIMFLVLALEKTQRATECRPWLKQVVTLLKTKEVPYSDTLMADLSSLATRARPLGLLEEADYLVGRAVKFVEGSSEQDARAQLHSLMLISTVLIDQKKLLEAEAALLKARKLAEAEPSKTDVQGYVFLGLGKVQEYIYALQGGEERLDQADTYYQQAFEKMDKVDGKLPPETASLRMNVLAGLQERRGRLAEALEMRKEALEIVEQTLGPKDTRTLGVLDGYVSALEVMGKLPEALKLQQDLLERSLAVKGGLHPDVAEVQHSLGRLHMRLSHYSEAEKCFERAAGIRERALGPNHGETAKSYFNLGVLRETKGDFAGATAYFEHVLKIDRKAHGEGSVAVAEDTAALVRTLIKEGRFDDALARVNESLKMVEDLLGKEHPMICMGLLALAAVQESRGRFEEAEQIYHRVIAIRTKSLGEEHGLVADARAQYAIFLISRNKLTLASGEMRRAIVSYARQRQREGTGAGDLRACLEIYGHILRKMQYDERTIDKHVRSLESGVDPVGEKSRTNA